MKKIYLVLIAFTLGFVANAQIGQHPNGKFGRPGNKERIEMYKVQFITERLSLTTAEAELFWPVYESHKKAVQEIIANKSTDEIQLQEAMLNARKKYKADLKPVLKTDERINEALKVEREFLKKVRFEMMRRRGFQS